MVMKFKIWASFILTLPLVDLLLQQSTVTDELFIFNRKFERRYNIHSRENFMHQFRNNEAVDLESCYQSVIKSNHSFCGIVRDNWSCTGDTYIEKLRNTPPFQKQFSLMNLKNSTSMLIEGNSYFAQKIFYWICESSATNQHKENMQVWAPTFPDSNDLYVKVLRPHVQLLLLDNDSKINNANLNMYENLGQLNISFDIIIVAEVNWNQPIDKRVQYYKEKCPLAKVIPVLTEKRSCDCRGDFMNCTPLCGHQCVPGPMLRDVEYYAANFIKASHNISISL